MTRILRDGWELSRPLNGVPANVDDVDDVIDEKIKREIVDRTTAIENAIANLPQDMRHPVP